jgi:hypothetical protein
MDESGLREAIRGEVALSTSDPLRHLRVTSVRSKVALSFDAHSLLQRHERHAQKTVGSGRRWKNPWQRRHAGDEEGREGSAALSEPS